MAGHLRQRRNIKTSHLVSKSVISKKLSLLQDSKTPVLHFSPLMWSRKCGQVLTVCCPEGTYDGSQAIYCLETRPIESPSRLVRHSQDGDGGRARSDLDPWLINRPNRGTPIGPNHTVPYGTVPGFAPIPGNKLPGYFHKRPY